MAVYNGKGKVKGLPSRVSKTVFVDGGPIRQAAVKPPANQLVVGHSWSRGSPAFIFRLINF